MSGIIIVLFSAVLFGLVWRGSNAMEPRQQAGEKISVGDTSVYIERANTPLLRMQGLSGRESLSRDGGMLFIFNNAGRHSFWMKDMKFPIDFIWIRDLRVVGITKDAPPEGMIPKSIYTPPEPIDMVLEVNAGFSDQHGISLGDEVVLGG